MPYLVPCLSPLSAPRILRILLIGTGIIGSNKKEPKDPRLDHPLNGLRPSQSLAPVPPSARWIVLAPHKAEANLRVAAAIRVGLGLLS